MIKKVSFLMALLAVAAGSGSAYATSCTASTGYNELTGIQIRTLLNGSLVCSPATGPYSNQEAHSGGNITDYKMGPTDPVDPSVSVGTYTVANGTGAQITYSYTAGGGTYNYTVWGTTTSGSGSYDFCAGTSPVTVRVVAGSSGPC